MYNFNPFLDITLQITMINEKLGGALSNLGLVDGVPGYGREVATT